MLKRCKDSLVVSTCGWEVLNEHRQFFMHCDKCLRRVGLSTLKLSENWCHLKGKRTLEQMEEKEAELELFEPLFSHKNWCPNLISPQLFSFIVDVDKGVLELTEVNNRLEGGWRNSLDCIYKILTFDEKGTNEIFSSLYPHKIPH